MWQGLLGRHTELAWQVAAAVGEPADVSATRVWSALECLQKAGRTVHDPLTLLSSPRPGWVVFACGGLRVASLATTLRDVADQVVFAVLTEGGK
ncbi:hypothetical protein [Catellatospora methionotrophica]|uniref:hypothetical protein n=1 Tax=Catellatospora methionotrophica TaxID=121620 RepID=UPI0033ECAFA6